MTQLKGHVAYVVKRDVFAYRVFPTDVRCCWPDTPCG